MYEGLFLTLGLLEEGRLIQDIERTPLVVHMVYVICYWTSNQYSTVISYLLSLSE